jgi:hypothetical protein
MVERLHDLMAASINMTSRMLCRVVAQIFTDVSEVLSSLPAQTKAIGSKHLWNFVNICKTTRDKILEATIFKLKLHSNKYVLSTS